MSDGSDQPKPSAPQSVNPFASPLAPKPAQSVNPFGASQLVGQSGAANPFAQPASPAASAKPFAAPSAPASPDSPAISANPFAKPAAAPAALPAESVNPFAAPVASTAESVNPFAAPVAAAPVAAPADSVNPFAAPASPAAPVAEASAQSAFDQVSDPAESTRSDGPSQSQMQQLNPLRGAATQAPSAEELRALAGDYKIDLVPRKTIYVFAIGAGFAALIVGFLIGTLFTSRSEHAKRVIAWKQIDRELQQPLKQLRSLEGAVSQILEGVKKQQLMWDQVEAIPKTFKEVDFSLLAPGVTMSQTATLKLSALLVKMQNVFIKASVYRSTTLKDRGAISLILDKKDFTALPVHAIHASNYLDNCLRRGRTICNNFDSLKRGSGRVVGLMSAKLKKGKLSVITRDSEEPFEVPVSDLVLVPRSDIVGSGMNPLMVHNQSLNVLKAELDSLAKTRNSFERILQEKRTLE